MGWRMISAGELPFEGLKTWGYILLLLGSWIMSRQSMAHEKPVLFIEKAFSVCKQVLNDGHDIAMFSSARSSSEWRHLTRQYLKNTYRHNSASENSNQKGGENRIGAQNAGLNMGLKLFSLDGFWGEKRSKNLSFENHNFRSYNNISTSHTGTNLTTEEARDHQSSRLAFFRSLNPERQASFKYCLSQVTSWLKIEISLNNSFRRDMARIDAHKEGEKNNNIQDQMRRNHELRLAQMNHEYRMAKLIRERGQFKIQSKSNQSHGTSENQGKIRTDNKKQDDNPNMDLNKELTSEDYGTEEAKSTENTSPS